MYEGQKTKLKFFYYNEQSFQVIFSLAKFNTYLVKNHYIQYRYTL